MLKKAILGKTNEKEETRPIAPKPSGNLGKPTSVPASSRPTGRQSPASPAPVAPTPVNEVDVERRLDAKPDADKLNWRTSIVDLMKLVGVDPSYQNRKDLAQELGRSDYSGTAEDNIWLHHATMRQIALNGGRVPASMTD